MSRLGLGVVSKWTSKMGYSPREKEYLSYLEKKKNLLFQDIQKKFF